MTFSNFQPIRIVLPLLAIGFGASACQEPQPKPDIPAVPENLLHVETIIDGLQSPWSLAELPRVNVSADRQANTSAPIITAHGGYLVTERGGALKWVPSGGGKAQSITGLPDDIYVGGQAGLFDVVLSPDFDQSRRIFLSYAYGNADDNGTAVVSAKIEFGNLSDMKTLYKTMPGNDTSSHFGGRIAFDTNETFLLSTGEGFAYREDAQDLASPRGKIMRLSVDGGPAKGNPFAEAEEALPEMYSYGHRNVQGLAIDPVSGTIWETEHGPRGGDELNIIKSGKNYGWPLATTGTDYNGAKITPLKTMAGTEPFVKDWVPSIAPSGLTIYRGAMFPEWNGDAFIGGLASKDLRRVDLEEGRAVGEQSLLAGLGGRIRDVRTARDGAVLVLIEDAENGKLLRITPAAK